MLSSRVEVRLGEHNIRVSEGTEQFISSSRVIRHPRYSSYNIDNDVMLIKLSSPATLNQHVKTVALPSSCAPAGTMCKVSGWGNTMSSSESCQNSSDQILPFSCWASVIENSNHHNVTVLVLCHPSHAEQVRKS